MNKFVVVRWVTIALAVVVIPSALALWLALKLGDSKEPGQMLQHAVAGLAADVVVATAVIALCRHQEHRGKPKRAPRKLRHFRFHPDGPGGIEEVRVQK